jgi:energy-converting hydrogenase Eha subunit E
MYDFCTAQLETTAAATIVGILNPVCGHCVSFPIVWIFDVDDAITKVVVV